MKSNQPFNPLPLPEDLQLEVRGQTQADKAQTQVAAATEAARKPRRKTKRKVKQLGAAVQRKVIHVTKKCQVGWQELKGRLGRKLGQLDREQLKRVLKACGIGAAIIAAILFLVKCMPVALTLLTILGLATAMALWDRLRYRPLPF